MPEAKRRLVRLALALTVLLLVCSAFVLVPTKKVEATPPKCGDVLDSGSSWAGGNGVDVHSNAPYDGDTSGNSCARGVFNLGASPSQWGSGWQCVELPQRMYQTRGWTNYKGPWPGIDYAAEIYSNASSLNMTATANGSIVLANIVPGDMIVTHEATYGHVMLVNYISRNTIYYVDQNGADGGMGSATYDPNTKKISAGSYYQISGVVHSPNNKLSNGSPPTPTVTPTTPVPPPPIHYKNSLAWFDGTTLWKFQGQGLSTTGSVQGYTSATWADVGDCNHDGVEDIYWYQNGTIYCILGPSFTYAQLLRGPGIGPPVWAGVGDFTGDNFRDSIAWFDGATTWLLGGPGLSTLSGTPGYSTPQWAGVGNYNHSSRDGIYWYQNGTIYFLQSDGTGFPNAQFVRGPGIGAPVWAAAGNFTGNGYRDSLAWYDGTIIWLLGGQGLATLSGTSGYTPPTWAGVGDYNQDGKDDIFWYIGGGNGTIYVLPSNGTSFSGAIGVRGPGIGAPQWAGVGYFGS